ncbi:MAG: FtsW/RodA/SpoVE family cell cycle protein, partial [bacterium]|nr:FtsW/RodA/SpoVE family cell cycle protein [bacterium]
MLNYRNLDWQLIGAALALSLIGILLILSAQYHAEGDFIRNYYFRQAIWLLVALAVCATIVHTPLRFFDFSAFLFYGVALFLLVLVLFIGSTRTGATRW